MFGLFFIRAKEVLVRAQHRLSRFLHLNIPFYGFFGNVSDRTHVVASAPQTEKLRAKVWKSLTQYARGKSLELIREALRCFGRVTLKKQVNMISAYMPRHDFKCLDRHAQFFCLLVEQRAQRLGNITNQHLTPILWTPNKVIFQGVNATRIPSIPRVAHRTNVS